MSKVICEICGTVYPDNATLCPICGYPRNTGTNSATPAPRPAVASAAQDDRVRGGRYSNSNVKRRNQATRQPQPQERPKARRAPARPQPEPVVEQPRRRPAAKTKTKKKQSSGTGLVITVVILLVAVILVGAYIGLRFFRGADAYAKATQPTTPPTLATEAVPVETGVACTDILVQDISLTEGIEFQGMGRAWRLNIQTVPANTTEEITYSSSDESVATIDVVEDRVEILSIAPGTTTITITCGSVTKEFPVECNFEGSTNETEETQEGDWILSHDDVSIDVGESFELTLTDVSGNVADVTWETDTDGITIDGNTITGKTSGELGYITCTHEGQTYTCVVRVN